jgi:hypothetical protein
LEFFTFKWLAKEFLQLWDIIFIKEVDEDVVDYFKKLRDVDWFVLECCGTNGVVGMCE